MPLYEYKCEGCAHHFELLVRGNETPVCPSCRGAAIERQLSVFAAHTSGSSQPASAPGACGRCGDARGPGACSMN